jgi:hypothetical protein
MMHMMHMMPRPTMRPRVLVTVTLLLQLLLASVVDASATASVCYRLPFSNPNLADGWGSTCCDRTNPHRGLDFPKPLGTAIPAVADGTVVVKTSTGCLGNVVVVRHADGLYSGYSHMQAQSSLATGTSVTKGQTIGRVGSTGTCTTGPHLHLTLSPHQDGYAVGSIDATVDPYAYIQAHLTCDRPPAGVLDEVSCDAIAGTAQDPDTRASALVVRVSLGGPPGDVDSHEFELVADTVRDAACAPTDACAHGFVLPVPAALRDDVERDVFASVMNAAGLALPLSGSPSTLRCPPPPLPVFVPRSVRRRVADDVVLTAWGQGPLSVVGARAAEVALLPTGPPLPLLPVVVVVDQAGADAAVFVDEGSVLRPVLDELTLPNWGLADLVAVPMSADDVSLRVMGAPWPSTPTVVSDDTGAIFVVDAPPPLWAERLDAAIPTRLPAGARVVVAMRLQNHGSAVWQHQVELVTAAPSPLCDASWLSNTTPPPPTTLPPTPPTDCTRIVALDHDVAPGEATTLAWTLHAPDVVTDTSLRFCPALVAAGHAFSEVGEGGPALDAWCVDVLVVAPSPGADPSPSSSPRSPSASPSAFGGCGCTQGVDAAPLGSLLVLWVWVRRRRGAPRQPA